ncbi:unnamed protein product [Rotaria socialis]
MTEMNEDFEFRVVLIKIQNNLSDADRLQLHFLFGEDIPRRLQSNGSLETTLEVLQTLFDRLKISNKNYNYLVRALEAIQRPDCVERLLSYGKLVPADIIPSIPQETQAEMKPRLPLTKSKNPTPYEILRDLDLDEEDTMYPSKTDSESNRRNLPEPDPIDFSSIDLGPFEDSSNEWTEEYSKSLNLKYHPRAYQIEIVRNAIYNKNTIVCLPTGSGKTFIASLLIKYYYIKYRQNNPNGKFSAFFFVPRKAIRLQQAKAISNVGNLRVQMCQDDQRTDQLIDANDVTVTTPQKFVNSLKNETIRLSQINLMIFDECHNTSGGNPYCEIMKHYLCPSKQERGAEKPMIIGLTATVSAKDSQEKKEPVEKNLISLCSKLDCKNISTVCDSNNLVEIKCEINRPINNQFEHVLKVQYNSYFQEYLNIYENLIKTIKTHLDGHELLDEKDIGSSSFIGQLIILKRNFETKGDMNNIIICDYLLLLTRKYSAFKDLPFEVILRHVSEKIKLYHEAYEQSVPMNNLLNEISKNELDKILQKHKENPTTNSKLETLIHLVKKHAIEKTKGLILVPTTFYAKSICDYLSDQPELKNIVKPTWIVGQNSADHSLTINDQQVKLRQFGEGECNVLIATDIVQEGLDVPTCSYVIRYEFVSDEIGTVQSRGRARAQNSSYYLITELDSTNHKREKNNKFREEEMDTAISKWQTIDKDQFQRAIEVKTKSLINTWEMALSLETQRKNMIQKIGKKDGSICCRKCNRELGELLWLKKRNTIYFINNAEFFNNNDCRLDSTYTNMYEHLLMGQVKCFCGNSLGGFQKFLDRPELGPLCALKCKQVKFKINKQMPFIEFEQWSRNNYFDVEELEEI